MNYGRREFLALVSAKCPNLLAAGGLVAAEPAAFASMRVQAQCMAMGQAAGTTAAFRPVEDVRRLDFAAIAQNVLEVPHFLRHENRRAPENKG